MHSGLDVLDRTLPCWPCARTLMAEEVKYFQLVLSGGGPQRQDRTVADLVNRVLIASSSGCSESLAGGSLLAAAENAAQPASQDGKVLSKAGVEAQQKVSWDILREYKSIYEVTSSLSTLLQHLDVKFPSRSIPPYLELRCCRVIASWLTK